MCSYCDVIERPTCPDCSRRTGARCSSCDAMVATLPPEWVVEPTRVLKSCHGCGVPYALDTGARFMACPRCGAERGVIKAEYLTPTIHVQINPGVDERALAARVGLSVMRAIIGTLDLAERNRPPRMPPGAR